MARTGNLHGTRLVLADGAGWGEIVQAHNPDGVSTVVSLAPWPDALQLGQEVAIVDGIIGDKVFQNVTLNGKAIVIVKGMRWPGCQKGRGRLTD